MAVCLPSLSDLRAERTLTEVDQEVLLELAKYKQDFRDVKEKLLISEATAYSLANQLQKNKCEACKDIVESVLGEKLMFEVQRPAEKLAEKPTLDERLRTCVVLIRSQARELTQLRQTLRDGKDDSVLLKQRLKDLLTHNDLDNHQGKGFRESLSEGYRLAERLACKFSPEIYEDEDDEQAQETLTSSVELQEVEKKEVPEECKDECVLMPSILQGSSDSHQPYSNDKLKFNELEVDLGPDGACGCSYAQEDEMPTNISDNENYHRQVRGQELTFPSVNLQDDEKKVVFQQPQDECVSVPSTLQEGSACNQPYSDGKFAFDEENVASAVDGACGCSHAEEDEIPTGLPENRNDLNDLKGPEVVAPRFSRQLPQLRENGVPRDSLHEYALTYSVLPSLSDSFWPYRSAAVFSLEGVDVSYDRDVTKNLADLEDEEDQDIISSSVEQLVGEENEVQPDSLDECYLAASTGHHLAGSCHPYRSASFPTESGEVFLTLNVNGDTWEDCHQGPVSFPGSEVPTSQAQLQKSTHVTDCLQCQLDQHFDCGDSKAMLGLSSTNWGFTSNPDSGNQGPLFLELDASIRVKNPPKLEGEGSTVCNKIKDLSVLKQKMTRRKLLFGKWRLACRFPGLQA
ncbi:neuroblastoma breakpoint family member 4-like isoform X1 [Moschus berezovskii]|uniref:neuroblastoma breakpoint family member 4-like isoform X1 n=1 Tax=Moschus berezovskii TaxID=68408 RepID=UPI002443EC9F|nr:neuroblastoma breakpoint family member 4-like isoform X1 [Moschus berezovskii]